MQYLSTLFKNYNYDWIKISFDVAVRSHFGGRLGFWTTLDWTDYFYISMQSGIPNKTEISKVSDPICGESKGSQSGFKFVLQV